MPKLSRVQLACVPGLARGDSIASVAEANQVSRRTIERWFEKDRRFVEFLETSITQRLERALEDNANALGDLGPLSIEALRRVLSSPREASVENMLRAAQIVQQSIQRVMEYRRPHVFRSKSK
jgi:hypothetical protein